MTPTRTFDQMVDVVMFVCPRCDGICSLIGIEQGDNNIPFPYCRKCGQQMVVHPAPGAGGGMITIPTVGGKL
jgi:hypothetical protein